MRAERTTEHYEPLSYTAEFRQLLHEHDMRKFRVEIYMTDGNRYWPKAITQEWEDAIRIIPENDNDNKPVFVMKHTIQSMSVMLRPVQSKRDG